MDDREDLNDINWLVEQLDVRDRAIDRLTKERNWLKNDLEATEMKRNAAAASFQEALARVEYLEDGIRRFLSGDFQNPRHTRPEPCGHGQLWYVGCSQCDDEYLEKLLNGETNAIS